MDISVSSPTCLYSSGIAFVYYTKRKKRIKLLNNNGTDGYFEFNPIATERIRDEDDGVSTITLSETLSNFLLALQLYTCSISTDTSAGLSPSPSTSGKWRTKLS